MLRNKNVGAYSAHDLGAILGHHRPRTGEEAPTYSSTSMPPIAVAAAGTSAKRRRVAEADASGDDSSSSDEDAAALEEAHVGIGVLVAGAARRVAATLAPRVQSGQGRGDGHCVSPCSIAPASSASDWTAAWNTSARWP
ncbi:hypothetical protein EON67_08945 [archaeon]|nr:MAG: hypothetical protein EON67_08945 [archaeon]